MKHFDEARQDVLATLSLQAIEEQVEKVCAIFDLKGRCRILALPADGKESEVVRAILQPLFETAADVFWGGEDVWIQRDILPSRMAIYEAVWKEAKSHSPGSGKQWILDRHLSKDAWFGSPFSPPWPLNDNTPPIISFFSFKGGVGRTTALAAFATNLARARKRVLVVDFDLEAPGVGTLFGPTGGNGTSFGVVDFLLEWPIAPDGTIDIADYCNVCDDSRIVGSGPEIICVPAGKVDERFIEKLARINYEYLYRSASEPGGPESGKSPIHQLLKLLRHRWNPDFVLIDSRAGLHDLGGLSLSGIAHWHVLFGLNSEQSWQGISVAVSHLGKQEVLAGRKQRDCTLVQSMTPSPQAGREQAVNSFNNRAFDVFSNLYYDDPQSPDAEWPVPDPEDPEQPHSPQLLSWEIRVFGYDSVTDVADILCEGEYRTLTNAILGKLGRPKL